jgi:peptide/nickel transport system substrate-binding protein
VNDEQPGGWKRLRERNFSSKDLSRRLKKVENVTVRHARRFVIKRWSSMRYVRRHIAIWCLMVGYIIAASALQLTWYQQGYQTAAAADGGTYAEAVLGPLDTLNPLYASSSAEQSASRLLFSSLMTYDTTGHLNYDLASNMTVDPTGKVYTVTLKPNAQWQDGQPITAQDVVFTVNLIKNPSTRSTISGWDDIAAAAPDAKTVTFTLPAVYAAFPHALNFPILPEHLLKDVDPSGLRQNNFSNKPVGSGPFTFRLLQSTSVGSNHQTLHMVRNDNYYGGTAKLERVQLDIYQSHDDIIKALATSEVSAAIDLSATDLAQVSTARYTIARKPINSGVYALFNTTGTTLKDRAIRQALQIGTNTTAIRQALGGGTPDLYLPFVNGQLSGEVPSEPSYNLGVAKTLLANDGWVLTDGVLKKDGQPLVLNVVTIKDNDLETALQKVAGQWRQLGITVNTTVTDPTNVSDNVVQAILQPRAYDVLIYQLNIGGDPDVYAYWHSSQATSLGFNFANYANGLSDDALSTARTVLQPELRNAKYLTFAKQWLADAPAIGLYQSTVQYVENKQVSTVQTNDVLVAPADRYDEVLNWSVNSKTVFTTP